MHHGNKEIGFMNVPHLYWSSLKVFLATDMPACFMETTLQKSSPTVVVNFIEYFKH